KQVVDLVVDGTKWTVGGTISISATCQYSTRFSRRKSVPVARADAQSHREPRCDWQLEDRSLSTAAGTDPQLEPLDRPPSRLAAQAAKVAPRCPLRVRWQVRERTPSTPIRHVQHHD